MSELRKANFDGLFFVTLTVTEWVDVFTRSIYSDIIVKSLEYCQKFKGLNLYAYVIMSNHLHLLASAGNGNLNEIIKDFKSFTAKEILRCIESNERESRKDWLLHIFRFNAKYDSKLFEYSFWQKGYYPKLVLNPEMLLQKVEYLHSNPVRAGYVLDPEHWYYSSACPRSPLKVDSW